MVKGHVFVAAHMDTRSALDEKLLVERIGQTPQLSPCGIIYIGRGANRVLKKSRLPSGRRSWIIVEEAEYATEETHAANVAQPTSKLNDELLALGLNCTSAAISIYITIAFAATGIGIPAAIASGVATGASIGQCMLSAVKVSGELGQSGFIEEWEKEYKGIDRTLDVISLASAGKAVGGAISAGSKYYKAVSSTPAFRAATPVGKLKSFYSPKLNSDATVAFTRSMEQLSGMSNKKYKYLKRLGQIPNRYSTAQVEKILRENLFAAVEASLSITGSFRDGNINEFVIDPLTSQEKTLTIHLVEDK